MIYDVRSELFKRFVVSGFVAKKDTMREMLASMTFHADYNKSKPSPTATSA